MYTQHLVIYHLEYLLNESLEQQTSDGLILGEPTRHQVDIKYGRILSEGSIAILVNTHSDKDQLMILEYDSSGSSHNQFNKIKLLDIQIGKISSFSIISKIATLYSEKVQMIFVDEFGTSMTLHLTPKTYRAKLPTKQSTIVGEGSFSVSEVLEINDFYIVANKNASESVINFIKKDIFLHYYFDTIQGEITRVDAYSYTDNYSLLLLSYREPGESTTQVQAVHYIQPSQDILIFKKDISFYGNTSISGQFSIDPNSGRIMLFNGNQIVNYEFSSAKCEIQIAEGNKDAVAVGRIEDNCIQKVNKLIDQENKDPEQEEYIKIEETVFMFILIV